MAAFNSDWPPVGMVLTNRGAPCSVITISVAYSPISTTICAPVLLAGVNDRARARESGSSPITSSPIASSISIRCSLNLLVTLASKTSTLVCSTGELPSTAQSIFASSTLIGMY